MRFLNIWSHLLNSGGKHNNYNNIGAISQSTWVKWNSHIVFLCAESCKLSRPTPTNVVGKTLKDVVFLFYLDQTIEKTPWVFLTVDEKS